MGKNALGPGDVQDQVDQNPCVQGPEPGLPRGTDYAVGWAGEAVVGSVLHFAYLGVTKTGLLLRLLHGSCWPCVKENILYVWRIGSTVVDRVWFGIRACFFPQQGPESEPALPCKHGW